MSWETFSFYLWMLIIVSLVTNIQEISSQISATESANRFNSTESPYCDLLLDRRQFQSSPNFHPKDCELHRYEIGDMVACVDQLMSHPFNEVSTSNRNSTFKFFFVGDSRIRQQFYSFIEMFPDYDWKWDGQPNKQITSHYDMDVSSQLLNIQISFRWRHVVSTQLINEISNWTFPPYLDAPNFMLIGIALHHVFPENGADHRIYIDKINQLKPILARLTRVTDVVWMIQQPVLDLTYFKLANHAAYVPEGYLDTTKVLIYNKISRTILESSGVRFWDSMEPMAREYIRSCLLFHRNDPFEYVNCNHWIHLGYVVINQSTQILANYLCNRILNATSYSFPYRTSDMCCSH